MILTFPLHAPAHLPSPRLMIRLRTPASFQGSACDTQSANVGSPQAPAHRDLAAPSCEAFKSPNHHKTLFCLDLHTHLLINPWLRVPPMCQELWDVPECVLEQDRAPALRISVYVGRQEQAATCDRL